MALKRKQSPESVTELFVPPCVKLWQEQASVT